MLKSYLTTALRHLLKNRRYSVLNAIGLSVGLACFTLIALWVKGELMYDRFHENADRIYRIGGTLTNDSGKLNQAVTPPPLAPALISDFPEVQEAVRIDKNDAIVKYGEKQFIEDHIILTDPSFFRIFSFQLKSGNPATMLKDPYSVVLTESMAKKYFGASDPVGHSIKMFLYDRSGEGKEYKVTGIIEDCPSNSHFRYDFLVSFATMEVANPGVLTASGWYRNICYTYIMIKSGTDLKSVNAKFPDMIEKYVTVDKRKSDSRIDYFLQPFTDIHLESHLREELGPTISPGLVLLYGTIGIIVLLLACINYVNLSIAVSSQRFKEVGMRKVMGAGKQQLIVQYLVESWLLAIFSLILAFAWIEISRSIFESSIGKPVTDLYTITTLVTLVAIASFAGLCSGLYPAFTLSSFSPINIVKGHSRTGSSGLWLRKGLVVLQYAITIILVIGVLVVQLQLNFIQSKDLGFSNDRMIVLGVKESREVIRGYDAFRNDLLTRSVVTGMTRSNSTLAGRLDNSLAEMEDPTGKKVDATVYSIRVDHDYLDIYKMKLLAGRFLSTAFSSDSTKGFVVNESATKTFGYQDPADAIGKAFNYEGRQGHIIGVVRDFYYNSLHYQVEPTCMFLLERNLFSRITVRFNGTLRESSSVVADVWKKHFPNSVFDFKFAEDALNAQYRSENRLLDVFRVFSVISLAIACLGLFALVSYSVQSRTKEIGIRKVLGASVSNILGMLSKEFLMLIATSAVVAIPIGYYFMDQWLNGFAYQVKIHPLVFVGAGTMVLAISWFTVSLRSISAAMVNPVDSLRSE